MVAVNVPTMFGALLLGGLFASVLSGAVGAHVSVYFKMYPNDLSWIKLLVFIIWFIDTCHTALIWGGLWRYFIHNYGDIEGIDFIPWTIALTITLTAILTFFVHCFFAHRIFILSGRNWFLTTPIVSLSVLRLASACATTAEMIYIHSFIVFKARFRWLLTLGLGFSLCVDILTTSALFLLLQQKRTKAATLTSLNIVIDSLIRYAFETGSLTCAGTIATMVCWLSMRNDLVFFGLHFIISKSHALSLLVTLNARVKFRHLHSEQHQITLPAWQPVTRRCISLDLTCPTVGSIDLPAPPPSFRGSKPENLEEPISFRITR